jgi:hypothetical protein
MPSGGRTIQHVFEVPNPSAADPMKLELLSVGCQCLKPDPETLIVAPNSKGQITFGLHVPDVTQLHRAVARFHSDLPKVRAVELELLVNAYSRLSFEPSEIPVVRVRPGSEAAVRFSVVLYQRAEESEPAVTVRAITPNVRVKVLSHNVEHDLTLRRDEYSCEARLLCDHQLGDSWDGTLLQEQVVCEHSTTVRREMTILWQPDLEVVASPRALFFSAEGSSSPRRVVISGPRPFAVVAAEPDAAGLAVSGNLNQLARQHSFECTFSKTAAPRNEGSGDESELRAMSGWIRFQTSDASQPEARVRYFVLSSGRGT